MGIPRSRRNVARAYRYELIWSGTSLEVHISVFQAVVDKLTAFERGINSANQMTRSILRSQPDEMVRCRLAALSKLPTEKLSNLVSILLDYRLLDTLCAIRVGSQPSGQPERLPIPLPPKIVSQTFAELDVYD
jgi:hypothetical protein